ncbi:MAG TPA: sulfite exporter TauE/SafE family protein [Edaphocola sp.]|nr:sulfite exporter TauE/SafE family protein [Edaphocola sp.]
MNTLVFASSFLLGIGSSLHCLGMCGPLVMAVPFPAKQRSSSTKFLYFGGKAIAYGTLGAIIGLLGLRAIWGEAQQYISIFAGAFIILLVLFPLLLIKNIRFPFQKYFQKIFSKMKESPKWYHFFQLGFLNGLLPCGMVYIALTAALASGSPLEGFIAMILFGIGTTPILWIVVAVKGKIRPSLKLKLKPISIGISILVGILLILRGLNLGIPFISPKMNTSPTVKQECCTGTAATKH